MRIEAFFVGCGMSLTTLDICLISGQKRGIFRARAAAVGAGGTCAGRNALRMAALTALMRKMRVTLNAMARDQMDLQA